MTRLKALELVGFKSFADRTRFEFPDGVTAIVGPNGSGKSNVVDAIKWVLGEQSVKSLRGKEMADVIFAGSAGRKPLNSAETTLVFDNSARMLPVESDDVQITRRVYRSGESEYLVNGAVSRLRDIRELLSGTGAATEAYSVIEQGRVDALLVASGRDRRAVFEEAAGITRFRSRRTEAIRRLERTEQNRQRLADIVGEIAARLATVKQQAARARRHQEQTARLRSLRLAAARLDLETVDAVAARHARSIEQLQEEIAIHEGVMADASNRLTRVTDEDRRLARQVDSVQETLAALERRAASEAATIAVLALRRREFDAHASGAAREQAEARRRFQESRRAVEAAEAAVAAHEAELHRVGAKLFAFQASAGNSTDDATNARDAIAAARRAVKDAEAAHATSTMVVARLEDSAARAAEAAANAAAALESARVRLACSIDAVGEGEAVLGEVAARSISAKQQLADVETLERRCASRAVSVRAELADGTTKLEALRERAAVLRELVANQEGISPSARALLASGLPGLCGVVADAITAEGELAPIVDAAIGRVAASLLVDSAAVVLDRATAEHGLDSSRGGRIAFLLADSMPPPTSDPFESAEGVVGRLDRLLSLTAPQHPAIERLLGRAWVVESLAVARRLLATAAPGSVFVTRDGETLSSDGILEIGPLGSAGGLVSRNSELAALTARAAELEATLLTVKGSLQDIETEQAGLRTALDTTRVRIEEESAALAAARAEADRLAHERRSCDSAVATAEALLRETAEREYDAQARLTRARDDEATVHATVLAALERLATAESAADRLEKSRGETLEAISLLRIDEAECRQRRLAAVDAVAARIRDRETAGLLLAAADRRLASLLEQQWTLDLERLSAGSGFAEATWAVERAVCERGSLVEARNALAEDRALLVAATEQARDATATLSGSLHAEELAAGDVRHQRERILERIRDDYGLDIEAEEVEASDPGIVVPADRECLDREIEELRRKLAASPSVNLEALAEAEELEKRHTAMQSQLSDLTDAKATIETLIERIDDESRTLLGATIEAVRGHFRGLFESLFGGGQADIVLDPTMDLLETTVEIVARPPGKEPRSISLLSGGEKTMTCVALLLAIFKSRPSPFCVLDEVDAALDEANVDRFVGVLRDFLSSTQFIVVTHSKKTMAAADNLYGVTMEESGVSKRVAVRIERAASMARAA